MNVGHYHVHLRNFSASKGHNAVEKGAYRAGLDIEDPLTGQMKPYAWKTEKDQIKTEMILPASVEKESKFRDPAYFFQEIRRREKAKNARYFKELEISLSREMPDKDRKELAREFSKKIVEKYNVPVNLSFHNPKEKDNPHFHLSIPLRSIEGDHFVGNKNRDLDKKGFLKECRELWAELSNKKFKQLGIDVSVDHRSYKKQGIEKQPQLHINEKAVINPEREKAKQEYNVMIKKDNKKMEIQEQRRQLKKEVKEAALIRQVVRENQREEVIKMAAEATLKREPVTNQTNTVNKLYENEIGQIKENYFKTQEALQNKRESNKERKGLYRQQRLNHKERMSRSKGVIGLKKADLSEMKLKHKELKAELKSYAVYNPLTWQKRREVKKQMRMNKIKQKRKKLEVKQEKAKQKVLQKRFKEQKKEYRKEKRKELNLYKDKAKGMLQIAKLSREMKKAKNMQIPGNVVSLKEYKQKFKIEKTKEQQRERAY